MSYTHLKSKIYVASKDYICDAYYQIFNRIGMGDLDIEDRVKVLKFEIKGCRINKGEKYHYEVGLTCGDFGVFRAHPDMMEIYYKYKIYEE